MNTRSYDAALKSIERITHPGRPFLKPSRRFCSKGTQSFANTQFEQAIGCFNQSIALGGYNCKQRLMPFTGGVNPITGLNRMQEAARNFNDYLSLTPQKNNGNVCPCLLQSGIHSFP